MSATCYSPSCIFDGAEISCAADMLYQGQSYIVEVWIPLASVARRKACNFSVRALQVDATLKDIVLGVRRVWRNGDWCSAQIYDRLRLIFGAIVLGSTNLEKPDSTTFVDPGLAGEVDGYRNLILALSDDENR